MLPTGSKPDDINKKHCNEISMYACISRFSVCLVYQTQAVHPGPLDFPTLVAKIKQQFDLHTMESKHSARENLCKSLHKNVLSVNSYECQRAGLKIERSQNCERSEQYFPVLSNVRRC